MPAPRFRNALVVYKKSAWEVHVAGRGRRGPVSDGDTKRALLVSHEENARTIGEVKRVLSEAGIRFRMTSRADLHPERDPGDEPDLFVSIGGDGTFLETSHQVRRGLIIGVNSSPHHSVGYFCAAERRDFGRVFARALAGRLSITLLHRLEVSINGERLEHLPLNDVLVTHSNPGATSRYSLIVGGLREKHRSSGVWIATPAGSTAGIRAAGGKLLPIGSDRLQYAVRESYVAPGERRMRLTRGVLPRGASIKVANGMIGGALFADGPRHQHPLEIGDVVAVRMSRHPLKVLGFRGR